jgi:GTP-binding protein EngB required for normal cell division
LKTKKNWLETLALEAETTSKINAMEQQYYTHMVAKTIKKINQKDSMNSIRSKMEWKLIRHIRNKLIEYELVITKADKGKTIAILRTEDYTQKVNNFIQENQFIFFFFCTTAPICALVHLHQTLCFTSVY